MDAQGRVRRELEWVRIKGGAPTPLESRAAAAIAASRLTPSGPAAGMDRRQTGSLAENSACAFLESQGFAIVARNFLRRVGELDVVARAGRPAGRRRSAHARQRRYGGAAASVGRAKQRRIAATAALLLQRHRELRHCRVRFDVIIVRDGARRVAQTRL